MRRRSRTDRAKRARPRETVHGTGAPRRTAETAAGGFRARPSAAAASRGTERFRPRGRESSGCRDSPVGLRCRGGSRRPAWYRRHIRRMRATGAGRDRPVDRAEWSDEQTRWRAAGSSRRRPAGSAGRPHRRRSGGIAGSSRPPRAHRGRKSFRPAHRRHRAAAAARRIRARAAHPQTSPARRRPRASGSAHWHRRRDAPRRPTVGSPPRLPRRTPPSWRTRRRADRRGGTVATDRRRLTALAPSRIPGERRGDARRSTVGLRANVAVENCSMSQPKHGEVGAHSIHLDARLSHHVAPLRHGAADFARKDVRSVTRGLDAEQGESLQQFPIVHRLADRRGELEDDRRGCSGGRQQRGPVGDVEIGGASTFRDGRHGGHRGRAPAGRHRKELEAAALHMGHQRHHHGEDRIHVAADEIGHRLGGARIGHIGPLRKPHALLEHDAGEMADGAGSG